MQMKRTSYTWQDAPFCEVVTHKRIVKLLNLTIISNYCIVIYAVTTLRFGCDLVDNI
nr:MAG TPA: hypothetical protein [Caudoviricetes sp.]